MPLANDVHDGHKGKGGAAQGEGKVGLGCPHGTAGHGVHHQRHGGQGQQLIEAVHGKQVRRHGNAQGDAIGQGEEGEEGCLPLLVLHILGGIQHRQRPQCCHNSGEEPPQSVKAQGEGQHVRQSYNGIGIRFAG